MVRPILLDRGISGSLRAPKTIVSFRKQPRRVLRLRGELEGPIGALSRPAALEKRLGHRFASPRLLEQALTHRSRGADNNERLEFLGDGVLGCAVADELYARFPQLSEGKLTRLRASLVREEALAEVAQTLGMSPAGLQAPSFRSPDPRRSSAPALLRTVIES